MYTVGFDTSAFDPAFKGHAGRGIGRYVSELAKGFKQFSDPHLKIEYFDHNTFTPSGAIDKLPIGKLTVKQQILFPTKLWLQGGKRFDTFHFPAHMDAPAWCKVPYILTVLDLIPLVLTDLYRADRPTWRFKLARWLEIQAIKNASMILAISANTARDVIELLDISPELVRVTPLGVDAKFFNASMPQDVNAFKEKYRIPKDRPIILYVGGIDQRKNYSQLIKVMSELVKYYANQNLPLPVLVMAGNIEQDRQYPKLQQAIEDYKMNEHVVLAGYVPDQDLLGLYKISTLFLFLSLYEGFGLPVLEAMACGLPVVASNNSSIPEVMGDCGLSVDPENTAEIVKAVIRILSSQELRESFIQPGQLKAKEFTWENTVNLTLSAYKDFAKQKKLLSGEVNA